MICQSVSSISNEELSEICKKVIARTNKYNLTSDREIKNIKWLLEERTAILPQSSSFSERIRFAAENFQLKECSVCGTHYFKESKYCTQKCYHAFKSSCSVLITQDQKDQKAIEHRLIIFADALSDEYIQCQVCGFKGQDISRHIKKHSLTAKQYKEQFQVNSLKCQKLRDCVKGENNPGYQHGGKFSAWSKNFKNGYDEERHEAFKRTHSEHMKTNQGAKESNPFCREFYDTNEDYIKSQSKNLEWFQVKYGLEEGEVRWKTKTEKWLATMNNKSEDEIAEINRRKVYKQGMVSKIELEFVQTLKNHIPEINHQFFIRVKDRWFIYDVQFENKIIEFNGDFWHMNPLNYDSDALNEATHLTANETWVKDQLKRETAKSHGFEVLTVWESEFKQNKQQVINQCINYLTA
jgi:hypothetical protein